MKVLLSRLYQMFCEICGKIAPHDLSVSGDYERYTCVICGNSREYRVR